MKHETVIADVVCGHSHYDDAVYDWLREHWAEVEFFLERESPSWDYAEFLLWFLIHRCDAISYKNILAQDGPPEGEVQEGYIITARQTPQALIRKFNKTLKSI